MLKTLEELISIIRQRKGSSPDKSYTSKLLNNKKLSTEKVKEEIAELIELLKNSNKVHEYRRFISFNGTFRSQRN